MRRALFAAALLGAGPALGAPYTFTPLPSGFTATALNNLGQVAGQAPANPPVANVPTATAPALLSGSTVTPLSPLLSFRYEVGGVNANGDAIGTVSFGRNFTVFALFNGAFAPVAVPSASVTTLVLTGLNDQRQITGHYGTPSYGSGGAGDVQSFISSGSSYIVVDVPGTLSTEASAINNLGQVVGTYTTVSGINSRFTYGRPQGFLYDAGGITTINVPGAASTMLNGINDAGEVSGIYTDTAGVRHGFTEAGGVFSDVTGPDGAAFLGSGVNNQGQLIGTFGGSGLSYLATPAAATTVPEPASALLLGGLAALGAVGRRRGAVRV